MYVQAMDLTTLPLPKLHVIGHYERMSFRVTAVEVDAATGSLADGARGRIRINRNLTSQVWDGLVVCVAV